MSTDWTFLTNHAHILLLMSHDPDLRMRDLAERVGITERAVHRIVRDLTVSGYIDIEKNGRRNHYVVNVDRPMRHPVEQGASVSDLIRLLACTEQSVAS